MLGGINMHTGRPRDSLRPPSPPFFFSHRFNGFLPNQSGWRPAGLGCHCQQDACRLCPLQGSHHHQQVKPPHLGQEWGRGHGAALGVLVATSSQGSPAVASPGLGFSGRDGLRAAERAKDIITSTCCWVSCVSSISKARFCSTAHASNRG